MSLISYYNLWANDIHIFTEVENYGEVLELMWRPWCFATAHAAANKSFASCKLAPLQKQRRGRWKSARLSPTPIPGGAQASFLAASSKANIWHRRLGHPKMTVMWKMIPILIGHDLCTSDAERVEECALCIQGKLIRQPSRWKLPTEMRVALYHLHGDWCGPTTPQSGGSLLLYQHPCEKTTSHIQHGQRVFSSHD